MKSESGFSLAMASQPLVFILISNKSNVPIVQYQKERSCCNASAIAISTLTSSSVKAKAFESLNHEHTTLSMLIVHSTNRGK